MTVLYNISMIAPEDTDRLFGALAEQLASRKETYSIVVVGGSALIALGLVTRSTRDVDVVALHADGELISAEKLPEGLVAAAEIVAADFGLPRDWLNSAPAGMLRWGLPNGFLERAVRRSYGEALQTLFASRLDQIHFKLYAVADSGPGRHLEDLRSLDPSEDELLQAARWSMTHDPSPGYRQVLEKVLEHLGVERVP